MSKCYRYVTDMETTSSVIAKQPIFSHIDVIILLLQYFNIKMRLQNVKCFHITLLKRK